MVITMAEDKETIILSGTKEEICHMLTDEFELDDSEAEFIFYLNVALYDKDSRSAGNENKTDFPEDENIPAYETRFFNTNYNIDYSKMKRELFDALIDFAVAVCKAEYKEDGLRGCIKPIIGLIADSSISFVKNITNVPENCRCVYYNAMKMYKENRNRVFADEDLDIYGEHPGDCMYRDSNFKCPYMSENHDECTMTASKLKDVINALEDIGVFKNVNGKRRLV